MTRAIVRSPAATSIVARSTRPCRASILYGDFCSGRLWGLRRSASGWENARLLDSGLSLSSFGEDESGNLYLVDYGKGDLHRLVLR